MPARLPGAFKFNPLRLHGKQLHDFCTLKELPETYAWEPVDCHGHHSGDCGTTRVEPVPVVDLYDPNAERLIGHACKTWGAFQIINHEIPRRLLDDVESASRRLFSLPLRQKLRAARDPDGVTGYGPAPISSFFSKQMWSEGFTIFGSPLEHARQLWPSNYMRFCDIIEEYSREMQRLAGKLVWLMLGSLGITKEDIQLPGPEAGYREASAALQLNSYPACPDPDRAVGLAAHTDSTLITILHQNGTGGLQLFREGCGWVTVPPLAGGLVINVGDLLHILSNGLYPSVLHRAMVNRTRHRLSVAYLYGPPRDVLISPVSKVVEPGRVPLYRPVSWSEYLGIKAKHFRNALSLVRLCSHAHANGGVIDANVSDSCAR
ncbi:hypothetical protein Nepgr_005489 [Nepenthes gracilis]|uniref:gibberellin 3beta-dioxygenase n=1 Tax=Nepenthes gracilis TaxID=150966 RepID=A0AAD3S3L4_NEPGR|nr:hypothetical protein Nepgr_005489 [Nepenthes gracilis]